MKILAVILARKNSKRLKLKNKKKLGKYPLFFWSILSAIKIKKIQDILVSTDDSDIIKMCKKKNINFVRRPKNLAKDNSSSADATIHAGEWYKKNFSKPDAIILLQPTSPFRLKKTILKGINIFCKNKFMPVVSVTKLKHKVSNFYYSSGKFLKKYKEKNRKEVFFAPNGLLYIIKFSDLKKNRNFLTYKILPLEVNSPKEILDIDDKRDFKLAKVLLKKNF